MADLVKLYKESDLGMRLPAYDGRKYLYTAGELPFTSREFNIKVAGEDDGIGGPKREREYKVVIKFVARANLHHLGQFLSGRCADAPQEALQILDIVMRELSTKRYYAVGSSFFPYYKNSTEAWGGVGVMVWILPEYKAYPDGLVTKYSVQENVARGFCNELAQMCQISGMGFNPDLVIPIYTARPDQVEKALKHVCHAASNRLKGKELELPVAILPDSNGYLHLYQCPVSIWVSLSLWISCVIYWYSSPSLGVCFLSNCNMFNGVL